MIKIIIQKLKKKKLTDTFELNSKNPLKLSCKTLKKTKKTLKKTKKPLKIK